MKQGGSQKPAPVLSLFNTILRCCLGVKKICNIALGWHNHMLSMSCSNLHIALPSSFSFLAQTNTIAERVRNVF